MLINLKNYKDKQKNKVEEIIIGFEDMKDCEEEQELLMPLIDEWEEIVDKINKDDDLI